MLLQKGQITFLLIFAFSALGDSKRKNTNLEKQSVDLLRLCGVDMKGKSVPLLDSPTKTLKFIQDQIHTMKFISPQYARIPNKELARKVQLKKVPQGMRRKTVIAFEQCFLHRDTKWQQKYRDMKKEIVNKFTVFVKALVPQYEFKKSKTPAEPNSKSGPKNPTKENNDHLREICEQVIQKMQKRSDSEVDDEEAIDRMCMKMMGKLWYHIDSDVSPMVEENLKKEKGLKAKRQGPMLRIQGEVAKNRREAAPSGSSENETERKVVDALFEELENEGEALDGQDD